MTEIEKMIASAQKSTELARVRAVLAEQQEHSAAVSEARERTTEQPEGCPILEQQFGNG